MHAQTSATCGYSTFVCFGCFGVLNHCSHLQTRLHVKQQIIIITQTSGGIPVQPSRKSPHLEPSQHLGACTPPSASRCEYPSEQTPPQTRPAVVGASCRVHSLGTCTEIHQEVSDVLGRTKLKPLKCFTTCARGPWYSTSLSFSSRTSSKRAKPQGKAAVVK